MALGQKTGGRVKGTPNKNTALLKDAILMAAELTGSDKEGKDGLTGYCRHLAENEPRAFSTLLSKVLPMQVNATVGAGDGLAELLQEIDGKSKGLPG